MQHIDIEKKIKSIRDSLTEELKRLNAIDESGRATDVEAFNRIMDEKIKEINALEPLIADETGVAKDGYAANIFFHQLELLNEMKKNHTINFDLNADSLNQGLKNETERFQKPGIAKAFKDGIRKIIKKFANRNQSIDKVR